MKTILMMAFCAILSATAVQVIKVSACPNERTESVECPALSAYQTVSCLERTGDCNGTIHEVETHSWGKAYSFCNHISERSGQVKTCYTSGVCSPSGEKQLCLPTIQQTYTRKLNKNLGRCGSPECFSYGSEDIEIDDEVLDEQD